MSEFTHTLHFGVVPTDNQSEAVIQSPSRGFREIRPSHALHERVAVNVWASGSWESWGADPGETTMRTIHIFVECIGEPDVAMIDDAREDLSDYVVVEGRLLDYATISTHADWSVELAVVTWGGSKPLLHKRASYDEHFAGR